MVSTLYHYSYPYILFTKGVTPTHENLNIPHIMMVAGELYYE